MATFYQMTLIRVALSILTLSMTLRCIMYDTQHKNTQCNDSLASFLSIV
jgi:hypothetical protein